MRGNRRGLPGGRALLSEAAGIKHTSSLASGEVRVWLGLFKGMGGGVKETNAKNQKTNRSKKKKGGRKRKRDASWVVFYRVLIS